MVNDLIGGAHSPLVIELYGEDLAMLREIGRQIVIVLYAIAGTSRASLFKEPPIPQNEIKVDRKEPRVLASKLLTYRMSSRQE
jgi:cobalt-zinc-cadmium resistance protein CzcA